MGKTVRIIRTVGVPSLTTTLGHALWLFTKQAQNFL
jgi:hypothetical protein